MQGTGRVPDAIIVIDGVPLAVQLPEPKRKRGYTIRRVMRFIAVIACVLWIIPPAYLVLDLKTGGEYLTKFSLRHQRIAMDANLIGRPEGDIVAVLGRPTEIRIHDPDSGEKAYVYAPISYFPLGAVEVRCKQGVVASIDPCDD